MLSTQGYKDISCIISHHQSDQKPYNRRDIRHQSEVISSYKVSAKCQKRYSQYYSNITATHFPKERIKRVKRKII